LDLSDFIDRFRGPLIGLIASWGANYIDASEIAQDSFADAYLNRESCRELKRMMGETSISKIDNALLL